MLGSSCEHVDGGTRMLLMSDGVLPSAYCAQCLFGGQNHARGAGDKTPVKLQMDASEIASLCNLPTAIVETEAICSHMLKPI